MKLNDLASLVP